MMYAPFIDDSDDKLSQLAQLQIFLTLLSAISLRTIPPALPQIRPRTSLSPISAES